MTKQAKILPTTFILCVCIQSTFLNSFLPKNSLHFFLLRCINILRLFCQKQLLVAIQHISVIFAFKRVDFCLMIPHNYQQLGFGCELIVSLSLSSSSYRWLIVGFPKYSSSYRWLKQLLVIVIVSPSVAFFNFETIWSTKSFQKVSSFEKLCFRKKVQRRTHKKRILTRMFDQNCLKVVPVKVARVSRRWSLYPMDFQSFIKWMVPRTPFLSKHVIFWDIAHFQNPLFLYSYWYILNGTQNGTQNYFIEKYAFSAF